MSTLNLATSKSESEAAQQLDAQHVERTGALGLLVEALIAGVEGSDGARATTARTKLVDWARAELVPELKARDETLNRAAQDEDGLRLLIDAQRTTAKTLIGLVDSIEAANNPVRAAAHARALEALAALWADNEQQLILPALAQSAQTSLADVAQALSEQLAAAKPESTTEQAPAPAKSGGGSCGCGGHDEPGLPELDARAVPHAIRHATIFGALDAVGPGSGMVLVAPHDPIPLLAQIESRWPGVFQVEYTERGPETWRLTFTR